MKNMLYRIISTLLCFSLLWLCIPVVNANADYPLWIIAEDLASYTSVDDLQDGWSTPRTGNTGEIGIDSTNGGYRILQTSPKYLTDDNKANGTFSLAIQRLFGVNGEDKENQTVLKSIELQGIYELNISYSAKVISKSSYEGVKLNESFFTMYIGETNPSTGEIDSTACALNLRFNASNVVITNNSTNSKNTMSVKSVNYADADVEDHTVKVIVNTIEQKVSVVVDGNTAKTSEGDFMKNITSLEGFNVMGMERMAEDSYFRINKVELKEVESADSKATKNVLNSLPEKLSDDPSAVISDISLPEINGVTWSSSDTSVVSNSGVVTRQSEDKEVSVTALVDLENNGGIYEKVYTMTVSAAEAPPQPDNPEVGGDLISFTEDFTKYSDFGDVPNWGQSETELAEITASAANGIEIMQKDTIPLVSGTVNGAQTTKLTHVIEGTIKSDEENRTAIKMHRFSGKFKFTVDFEVYCPSVGTVDGVSITQPFFNMIWGQATDINNVSAISTPTVYMRLRTNNATVLNSNSTSTNSMTPTALNYDTSKTTHQLEFEFDTDEKVMSVTFDGAKASASTGPLASANYLNAFSISAMDRMKIGSYVRIKKIKVDQVAPNENITEALNALDSLPLTLSDDPFAVTDDIVLPEGENITWSTSDSSIIDENGTVHRWYNDREVVITAAYNDGNVMLLKDYTMTVKATGAESKNLMNEAVVDDEGWTFDKVTSPVTGEYKVTSDGMEIKKITAPANEQPEYESKSYMAYYRIFGKEDNFNEAKSNVTSSGYSGVYDISFKLKSSVNGNVPAYIEVGNSTADTFVNIMGLNVTKKGITAEYGTDDGEVYVPVFSGDTYGKTFDITMRVDTENKQCWVFVDGELKTSALNFANYKNLCIVDTLRMALDSNNMLNDSVAVNNIRLDEWKYTQVPSKQVMLEALSSLKIENITSNPDAADSVNLPESIDGMNVTWSCNSDLIDVNTGSVFHEETAKDVVLYATIGNSDGVYARKSFAITVRAAANDDELLENNLKDLAQVITAQDKDDIRYNLNLPTSYKGMQIEWTSSDEQIIDANGVINRNTAVTAPAKVTLTAYVTAEGKSLEKTFDYTVSPYAYEYTVYSGTTIPQSFTSNVKVARDTVTKLVFGENNGKTDIALVDSQNREAVKVAVDGNTYSLEYGDGSSDIYTINPDGSETVEIRIMPDICKIAVWRNGQIILDYCPAKDDIADFSGFAVTGDEISLSELTVKTDEYGALDINKDNIDYFVPFKNNVVEKSVDLVTDVIMPARVDWISSNPSVISNTGVVTVPSVYEFVDMTLQLTSLRDDSVKRVVQKTIAVACGSDRNVAGGAKASVSTLDKDMFPITNLTDNDKTTVFGATGTNKQPEIVLDFGSDKYLNCLFLNENFDHYEKGIKKYEISYSTDGTNWTAVKSGSITDLKSNLIAFDTISTRYLKFKITECEAAEVYINELEAYLFADSEELVRIDIDTVTLDVGYGVKTDIELPSKGLYNTPFTWVSSNPEVISADGKLTKPDSNTTVTLTVSASYDGKVYSKSFSLYVPGKTNSGGSAGGGGGSGAAWTGPAEPIAPGFVESNNTLPNTQPNADSKIFGDVDKTHWAYDEIKALKDAGIVNGDENGNFNPSSQVTREQFLKMLMEAADVDTEEAENTFDDVLNDAWYSSYVLVAKNMGIVNGVSDTHFGIGTNITRQDMAVMINRTIEKLGLQTDAKEVDKFADDSNVSEYAKEAVTFMKSIGLIEGYNNEFRPIDNLTRAEAATVISKLVNLLK